MNLFLLTFVSPEKRQALLAASYAVVEAALLLRSLALRCRPPKGKAQFVTSAKSNRFAEMSVRAFEPASQCSKATSYWICSSVHLLQPSGSLWHQKHIQLERCSSHKRARCVCHELAAGRGLAVPHEKRLASYRHLRLCSQLKRKGLGHVDLIKLIAESLMQLLCSAFTCIE